jgi:cytochrome c-type biogenesis protein CcmH/NrfF
MDLFSFLAGAACSLFFSSLLFYLHYENRLRKLNHENEQEFEKLTSQLREARNQSQELTDFLADFKSHGYSFVRVDPGAVFMRSPREL